MQICTIMIFHWHFKRDMEVYWGSKLCKFDKKKKIIIKLNYTTYLELLSLFRLCHRILKRVFLNEKVKLHQNTLNFDVCFNYGLEQ